MSCSYCVKGYVGTGKDRESCKHCMTPKRFIISVEKVIKDLKDSQPEKSKGLQEVIDNLPEYPVMAVMVAEENGLNGKTIDIIKSIFDVKPFMDVSYQKK